MFRHDVLVMPENFERIEGEGGQVMRWELSDVWQCVAQVNDAIALTGAPFGG